MAKGRSKVLSVYRTVGEVDQAMAEMAKAQAVRDRLTARMNEALTKARERFEADIEEQSEIIEARRAQIKLFADENRDSVFQGKQSCELTHGILSYRLGQLKSKTAKKWTWKKVVEKLLELRGKWTKYVQVKHDPNRQQMLADYKANKLTAEDLAKVGVEIEQEETFAVDLREESPQDATASAPGAERKAG